jgi:zinc-binding alcohol dehydrogenase/oxidoreductase
MRAVVMRDYGGPEVLGEESVPDPARRPGWVTVRLQASALNWHDVLVRRGAYRSPLPHVPGADGSGIREDTGEPVVVLPSLFWGGRAAAPTVYRALFSRGRLTAGESVLVIGAGGGIATMAVSLAAAAGARVFVTSSTAAKIEAARQLGAAGGVEHGVEGWTAQARAMSPRGEGFGQYELIGTTMGSPADMRGLLRFMGAHAVPPPVIDSEYPLTAAAAAHQRMESGLGFGKIVLSVSD